MRQVAIFQFRVWQPWAHMDSLSAICLRLKGFAAVVWHMPIYCYPYRKQSYISTGVQLIMDGWSSLNFYFILMLQGINFWITSTWQLKALQSIPPTKIEAKNDVSTIKLQSWSKGLVLTLGDQLKYEKIPYLTPKNLLVPFLTLRISNFLIWHCSKISFPIWHYR